MSSSRISPWIISSEQELRKIIPAYPSVLDKRILNHMDHYCLEIIEHASMVVFASNNSSYPISLLDIDCVEISDDKTICIRTGIDKTTTQTEMYGSLYFLVPGVGHGLRINGSIRVLAGVLRLSIQGAYVHCARAAARSQLWQSSSQTMGDDLDVACFLNKSAYLFLKTTNSESETELSPRGDQEGFVKMIDKDTLFIPERPGNKVAISLRNILQNSAIEVLLFIPGASVLMRVRGVASITTEDQLLEASAVGSKKPKLGIRIESCEFTFEESDTLARTQPWKKENQTDDKTITRFPKVLSSHMHGEGLLGKATTPIVNAIVKNDMNHLY